MSRDRHQGADAWGPTPERHFGAVHSRRLSRARATLAWTLQRPWQLERVEEDVLSGKTMKRPGLQRALEACRGAGNSQAATAFVPQQDPALGQPSRARRTCANICSLTSQGHLYHQFQHALTRWIESGAGRLRVPPRLVDQVLLEFVTSAAVADCVDASFTQLMSTDGSDKLRISIGWSDEGRVWH